MFLGTLGASLFRSMLAGKRVIKAGGGTNGAGQNF